MKEKYFAFLRGINVGGHHKVPMAELRKEMEKIGFENILTLLNSGNIIFDAETDNADQIEKLISEHIEKYFGFPIPTIVRNARAIQQLFDENPFNGFERTKEIRFYISLLKKDIQSELKLPWASADKSYHVIEKKDKNILSVLDVSVTKTPKAMEVLEKSFGKNITTRNWNTIERMIKKING
ncbi:MAG: DUF1697 domain-containing protein [Bacteroidota bacterium]